MDIDPRKKYAMKHLDKCDRLPDYIKIHIPECKRKMKDYAIGPGPRPTPPGPGPGPTPPPIWTPPLDVPWAEPGPNYTAAAIATGIGVPYAAERISRRLRRANRPRGARVAPEEGERGSRRRMRARVAPAEERQPLIRQPPEIPPPDTAAVAAEADSADARLASGVRRALDVGDRIERAGRTVPTTGDAAFGIDPKDLPRATPRSIIQTRLPPPSAPVPDEMERELPPSIDDPGFEMPDRPITTQERTRQRRLRSGTSVLPDDPNYARTSRGAPRGAVQPHRDGTTARTATSDLNPSVRPTPKREQLTKQRKISFLEKEQIFAPTEHPSEINTRGYYGPAIQSELDSGVRTTPKGKGKALSTREGRAERVSSVFDNMSGRQQDRGLQTSREADSRGRGLQTTSFMSGDDHIPSSSTDAMLDDIEGLQNRRGRGSIRGPTDDPARVVRGRGLGTAQTIEDPREPTEISDDQGGLGGEGDFENVPLLETSDGGPPRMSNYTKIKRALQSVNPLEQIQKLTAKVSGVSAPTEATTTTTRASQAATELASAQTTLASDQSSLANTRSELSTAQSTLSSDRAAVVSDQATVTSDTTALSSADLADDQTVSAINQAVEGVGEAEDGGFGATYAENLDGGVGVSQSVAEKLGLFGEKLAASTGGRVIGGALKVIGTPIRVVQAVGDAAGDVLKQGAVKVGTKVAGDVGARIALTAARATGLVASAAGITTGGGILDPVTDAIGLGLLLAIPLQMAGTAIRHAIEGQTQYGGISGATKAGTNTDLFYHFNESGQKMIKKAMKGVPMDSSDGKWWKPATIKAVSEAAYQENEYLGNYNLAAFQYKQGKGNEPVYYDDKTTKKSGFVVPLNDQQIKNAMATYQKNPDAFDNFDPLQLEIMGLNPQMSQGKSGATKVGNIYVPSQQPSGKNGATTSIHDLYGKITKVDGKDTENFPSPVDANYSDAFLSWNKLSNKKTPFYFTTSSPPTIDPTTYVSDTQTVINGMTNATAKAYMVNQLAWFKYYNVAGSPKPSTKIAPPTDTAATSALTDATNDLTHAQNQLAFQITSVEGDQTAISNDQTAVNTLQSKITNLLGQSQTTTTTTSTAQQLANYQAQANAYNLNVAQQVEQTEQNFQATTGLTAQDYQGLNKVLQDQITATGVTTYTQNQLAGLQGAGSGTLVSQQGPTGQTLTSTGVNTRAGPSPSGNSGTSAPPPTTTVGPATTASGLAPTPTTGPLAQSDTNPFGG